MLQTGPPSVGIVVLLPAPVVLHLHIPVSATTDNADYPPMAIH
jgi:hypothetical protein